MKPPKHPLAKLRDSSTFWLGMGALVFDQVAKRKGWPIDSNLLLAIVGAYGIKEHGAHAASGQAATADTLSTVAATMFRPPERTPPRKPTAE